MKLKKRIKRTFLAMICIVSLFVSNFSPFVGNFTNAATTEGAYKELTFSDWGMTNGEYEDQKEYSLTDTSITTLDGVALNGMFEVSESAAFYFGGTSGWGGIFMHIRATDDGTSEQMAFSPTGTSGYEGGATLKLPELQETLGDSDFALLNNEFQLRLTFDVQEDNGLLLGVYIDGILVKEINFTDGGSAVWGTKMLVYLVSGSLDLRDVVDGSAVYEEKTFKDFGIYPGTLSSDKIGTNDDIASLDEVAVSGKIKFGSGWLMMGHEDTANTEWSGIQMYANESGLKVSGTLFSKEVHGQLSISGVSADGTASTTEEGYVKVDFSTKQSWYEVNFSSVEFKKEIHIFMKNDSNSNRIVSLNWKPASKVIDESGADITASVVSEGNTIIPANSGWLEVIYPVDASPASQLNCYSQSADEEAGSLLIKGYYTDAGTRYGFTPSDGQISNEEAGVDFTNDYVDLRLTFDYTASGLDMGVYVGNKFVKTIRFADSSDGAYNIKDLLGPCVMASAGISYIGTYKELTLADFGIPSGFLTSDTIGTNDDITSLDGVAVSGAVKFGSGWLMVGHESAERGDWSGIQMSANTDNNLKVSGNLFAYPPLSQLSITSTSGSTYSTTEKGYIKVDFDGTANWCDVNFSAVSATGEIHVFMKNDSDYPRYVQMNWTSATKVLKDGVDITDNSEGATKIPANSGWVEVIYSLTSGRQFNCISRETSDGMSTGSLLIKGYYVDERAAEQAYNFQPSDSLISTGADFANEYVNLRYTFDYTETGVNMGVYVNDNFVKTITFGDSTDGVYNIKECLGKYIMATAGFTYMEELPEEDAKSILEEAGYTRVVVTDFGTMGYKSYTATDNHQVGEYAWADTLNKTYLDMNVTFNTSTTNDGYIRYGSSDGWNGVNVSSDGTSLTVGLPSAPPMTTIVPQQVGLTSFDNVNIKIALDCGEFTSVTTTNSAGEEVTYNVADYTLSMWVNNRKVIDGLTKTGQTYAGNTLAVYVGAADAQITLNGVYTDVDRMDVSYELTDASPSYLVTGTATVLKDGEEITLSDDCAISAPGDYEVITDMTDQCIRYHQKVALYKIGDVDLNGTAGEASDLTALEAIYVTTSFEANSAAEKAADLDNDGRVDAEDWQLMKQIVAATDSAAELKAVKAKYHPAARSYDYLDNVANEQDVMPIVGYYGPYNNEGTDLLKDEYYQLVKGTGINLVSYSYNNAGGQLSTVIKTLKMAEKHQLGWFVYDESLNSAKTGVEFTDKEFAATLGRYAYYDTFLGILIADEPYYAGSYEDSENHRMEKYTAISERLNKYNNLTGHLNLAPEDSYIVNSLTKDYFDEYFDQYVKDSKPQILSLDDYPFNDKASEGVTNASGYFRSLSKIREQSVENDIPFWWYVQAGGYFKNTNAFGYSYSTGKERVATEPETYWNVNTALAFGAKGIQYFTLIQSKGFYDEDQAKQLNGLLDANGNKNEYYDYAVKINAHIANVDEVLMKAESKGVITTGGHAKTEVDEGWKENQSNVSTFKSPVITAADTSRLKNVTSDDSTYGALIGCFDYRNTEAYYVMNYNVTAGSSQKVTLTFNDEYNYRIIQQGQSAYSVIGTGCELTIPAGEAVLVVLDGISGDANGDGAFDSRDLVRHKRVDAKEARLEFVQGYGPDLNKDSILDELDIKKMRNYLAWAKFEGEVLPLPEE